MRAKKKIRRPQKKALFRPAAVGGWIATRNKMGYMTEKLSDPFSKAFVDFAPSSPGPLLDIGAAYGVATLAAIEKGATVIANDLDSYHLDYIASQVATDDGKKLKLYPGRFPEELNFPEASLGGVLLARVLHFFDGPTIETSAKKLFGWLRKGGKVFVVAETPYTGYFVKFAPVYEARKKQGETWPGFIDDLSKYNTSRDRDLPNRMHVLDPDVLSRVFRDAGFTVERAEIFARPDFPPDIRLDGREGVGIIAVRC